MDRLSIVPRFRTPRDDILLARLYTHQVLIHGELVLLLVLPSKPVRPKRFMVRCVRQILTTNFDQNKTSLLLLHQNQQTTVSCEYEPCQIINLERLFVKWSRVYVQVSSRFEQILTSYWSLSYIPVKKSNIFYCRILSPLFAKILSIIVGRSFI